jgi:hypothetical protein
MGSPRPRRHAGPPKVQISNGLARARERGAAGVERGAAAASQGWAGRQLGPRPKGPTNNPCLVGITCPIR